MTRRSFLASLLDGLGTAQEQPTMINLQAVDKSMDSALEVSP